MAGGPEVSKTDMEAPCLPGEIVIKQAKTQIALQEVGAMGVSDGD